MFAPDSRRGLSRWRLKLPTVLLLSVTALVTGCGGFASQGLNAEGVRLFEQAQYQQAIRQFQQAIYNDPNNADGYYNLAAAYHRLGTLNQNRIDLEQAENYYNQCLDRAPDHRECYRGLAVLLVEQQRAEEAFRLLEGWADRRSASPEPRIELARLYQEFGDREAAKAHLVDAVALAPNNARALAALGNLREQMGEHAQALANYRRSLMHDRFQPEVAARIASLQSSTARAPSTTAPTAPGWEAAETRIVDRESEAGAESQDKLR